MASTEGDTKKTCPKCKTVDFTSFSTCRACGSRYDYKPEEKSHEVKLGLPLIIAVGALFIGIGVYEYQQMITNYEHPDKLVGKTLKCVDGSALVSTSAQTLISMDTEIAAARGNDPHLTGKSLTGALDAASSLNSIASGKDTSMTILVRYLMAHEVERLRSEDALPLTVKVVGTNRASDKFRLVQVRVAGGKHADELWWMNVTDLDLASK